MRSQPNHPRSPISEESPQPAIVADGATVELSGRIIWSNVSLTIDAGTFGVVLGPNGVGKSTLLKAILGLERLASGRLAVLGEPPRAARDRIGYVPQRGIFDPSVRIRGVDLVRLGLDGTRWGVPLPGGSSRLARQRVDEVIELVGGSRFASRSVGELSGGEQQRLIIAQALVKSPSLLLLDEPLDSLDISNQSTVAALIQRICRESGITVVMVAHDVNPILRYVDEVTYLAGGGAASGPPEEVINSETLSALYGTRVEVLRASDGRLVVVGQPEAPAFHTSRHPGHAEP
jgi:zinc/manganese transport system ATP-binding protein